MARMSPETMNLPKVIRGVHLEFTHQGLLLHLGYPSSLVLACIDGSSGLHHLLTTNSKGIPSPKDKVHLLQLGS